MPQAKADREGLAKRLLAEIVRQPGQSERGLARGLGISPNTVGWLVWHLEKVGQIRREVTGRKHHIVPKKMAASNWRHEELKQDPALMQLVRWVQAHPGAFQREILDAAEGWGWPRATSQHRLRRLEKAGMIAKKWRGRTAHYA